MQQHIYFVDDDNDDDLTGQQDVEMVKSGHQCGGLEGSTRPGGGSVESTEEYGIVCGDRVGDVVVKSPRQQMGASQAVANMGSVAAVAISSGKPRKATASAAPYVASLSEAGPGIHGLRGGAAAADAAVHITLGVPAATGAAAGTQEAAQRRKALRKSLKRKMRLQASMSPEGLAFGQASAQGAGAASSAARFAEAAAVVTAKEAGTLLAGAGQTQAPPNAAATASVQRKKANKARMTTGHELPAPQAAHARATGNTILQGRPPREGAEVAWRQDQCDRIAQELVERLQSGLQGLTVEEVLAAAMVEAVAQRHGRPHPFSQAAGGADGAPLQNRRHMAMLPARQLPAGYEPSAPAGRHKAAPASQQEAAGVGVGLIAQHRQGTTALGPLQAVNEAPQGLMHQQAEMLGAQQQQQHAPAAAQQGRRNVTPKKHTQGDQDAEDPPHEAAAADSELPDNEEAESEGEAAAHCLSELAAGSWAHPTSAAAPPAGNGAPSTSTSTLTAPLGPGRLVGSCLPKKKCLLDVMKAAPMRLGLNARRERRTEAVTGGPLAILAAWAAGEGTPAKARSPPRPGQGERQRLQIGGPSQPERPRHARSVRPPQRLDPTAEGVPQWAARQAPPQQEAPLGSAAAAPLRGGQAAAQAAGSAAPGAQPVTEEPGGAQLRAKRAQASQAANALKRERAHTGRQHTFSFVAPTPEDLGYWDRPAGKKVLMPKFKEDCVKHGIDQAAIKACHKCASQHLSHPCQSSKLECGPDNYKGNQHRQKISFCFRCIEGTERCYGLWRYVKDAGDADKLALFKEGWCVKCIGLCPCSKCKRLKLTDARDRPQTKDAPDSDSDQESGGEDGGGPSSAPPRRPVRTCRRSSGGKQQPRPGAAGPGPAAADSGAPAEPAAASQPRSKRPRPSHGDQGQCVGTSRKRRRLQLAAAKDLTRAGAALDGNKSDNNDSRAPRSHVPHRQQPRSRAPSNRQQQAGNDARRGKPARADSSGPGGSCGSGNTTASKPHCMRRQRAAGQPSATSQRSMQPGADGAQPHAGGEQSDGKQAGNGNSSSGSHVRRKLPRWLRRMGIQVMEYDVLAARAQDPEAPWISIKRGLVVVDAACEIRLLYLRRIVSASEARRIGGRLGSLHGRLVTARRCVKRGQGKNLPRADGSVAPMVQVGKVAARSDPNTILRTVGERADPSIQLAADEVVGTNVRAIKLECPWAFAGLSDWQQSLLAIVPNSCMSVATISADYQSPPHRDQKDVILNALMSATAWFARGKGLMPAGAWMRFHDLKIRLETCSGACVLFDSANMWHGTKECEPAKAGEAARVGISLQCRTSALAVADTDIARIVRSLIRLYRARLQKSRKSKGQVTRDCEKGPIKMDWPKVLVPPV